jgi:RNA polymerase sporulation-specific sigma factor
VVAPGVPRKGRQEMGSQKGPGQRGRVPGVNEGRSQGPSLRSVGRLRVPRWPGEDARSDEELALAAQRGEERAAELILKRYEGLCANLAFEYRYPGGEREDVLQVARLGVLTAIRGYRPERGVSFVTFCTCCARHEVIDVIKRERCEKRRSLNEAISLNAWDEERAREWELAASTERVALSKGLPELLLRARERLTPLEWAVALAWYEDESYQEIACRLNIGVGSAENAWRRVREKLRAGAKRP